MTSGLDQWQNPAIDEATAVSDFDFRTIRRKPFSVYLVVQPLMVKPLAPLIWRGSLRTCRSSRVTIGMTMSDAHHP
jgi:type IV secretory pathway TraG/TraD family ATPase VirD4